MDYDTVFNTTGKFPTKSNFWVQYIDEFVAGDGITNGFSTVMGEQVYKPLGDVVTPFYNRFAGRPLNRGEAWIERALYKNVARHFKPKATAEDDLSFVDSQGLEIAHKINVAGWIKTTIPSSLESIEEMLTADGIGTLNSMLVDNVLKTYQESIESEIGKYFVSNINNDDSTIDFTNGGATAYRALQKLAISMMGEKNHYNTLTEVQNNQLRTRSEKVLCFIDAGTYEDMITSFASLPSPERLNNYIEFIPMIDGCPTPLTTAEFSAGTGPDASGTTITWSGEPVALDEDKPVAIICDSRIMEYRPLIGSYKINLSKNSGGDFNNEHLLYKGALAYAPWYNAIRLYQS